MDLGGPDSEESSSPANEGTAQPAHATTGAHGKAQLAADAGKPAKSSNSGEPSPQPANSPPPGTREVVVAQSSGTAPPPQTVEVAVVPSTESSSETAPPARRPPELEEEHTPRADRFCIMIWITGAALTFPLVVAAWLLLVPILVHTNWTMAPAPPAPTVALTTPSTVDPWQNVPPACLVPVALPPLTPPLTVGAPVAVGNSSNVTGRPIFCLFNNSRVDTSSFYHTPRWHYVFEELPFTLCPNVVYWSVGIENGELTSRLPMFDEWYGLYRLRNITNSLNYPAVKILLALGGYRQDAPHFSRLGRDDDVMELLMRNVKGAVMRYGLNGVTVHWVEPDADCRGPDDQRLLKRLLRRLRTLFDVSLPGGLVTVILDPGFANERLAHEAADVVDHFFLSTQHIVPSNQMKLDQFCEGVTQGMHEALRRLASAVVPPKLRRSQLCLTDSVLPFLVKGALNARMMLAYSPDAIDTRVPVYWGCNRPGVCRIDPAGYSCFMHVVQNVTTDAFDDWVFLTSQVSVLRERLSWAAIGLSQIAAEPDDPPHACVLLLDFYGDNFVDQCSGSFSRYAFANHFYYGTLGYPLFGGAVLDAFARC
ncbi:hypothetical protein HPB49_004554 [Dermacentor silvarum]|uniref:Uncharacterized protein n=1 Tax=Dermacentor silvarum TaxID=543639 RepID=A0ACB8DAT9_DERSI|nr:hypothetical protein HPB49_004554 [Dermacentor silvarum]